MGEGCKGDGDVFEDGKLKNQKLSKKSLITKPEFKQHYFQFLHNVTIILYRNKFYNKLLIEK